MSSSSPPLRVAMVAGESSGDLLGERLITGLKARLPEIEVFGIGGPLMTAAGCRNFADQERLAVRGLTEVLRHLPGIWLMRRRLIRALTAEKPDVFVGIDAPDFNFGVEKAMKRAGVPTVHYVSPSIWAWRPGRVKKIVKIADTVLCLFPMEPDLYRRAGGKAVFVGHPLARMIPQNPDKQAERERLKLPADAPIFTLMPGSRVSEVDNLAPMFLQAARLISDSRPQARFLLPAATAATRERLTTLLETPLARDLPLRLLSGHARDAIVASDVVLAASGTATLEIALCKRPQVVAYKISPLTFALVKSLFRLPFVSLPNILLNRFAVPELLQKDATAEAAAAAVLDWYDHPEKVLELREACADLHLRLLCPDDDPAAQAVLEAAKTKNPLAKSYSVD